MVEATVDLIEIVSGERDGKRAEILFEAIELSRAEQRDDPWLAGEQPGQGDLRRGCP